MALKQIMAQLTCADHPTSTRWFTRLFGRAPDVEPMPGLAEWHHAKAAGLQLFEDAKNAGGGTVTLIVDDIAAERDRLDTAGVSCPEIEQADFARLLRIKDPDGNMIVLSEPKDV